MIVRDRESPGQSGARRWSTSCRGRQAPCEKRPVGILLEVPAAALPADHTAKEVAFFSSGIRLGTALAAAAEVLHSSNIKTRGGLLRTLLIRG